MAAYYTYNFLPPVSSDLDSLLHDFEQEANHDYVTFASVWHNHKLELLFKATDIQPNSFRFFLDDSLTVAAAYLGEPWRLPIQLGALYCLFTIYMYQIEEPKIKIRLTIDTLNSFLEQIDSSSIIPSDARTILSKLFAEHAFVISATRHEMGPRFFTKVNYMKSGKYMRSDVLLSSRLNIDEKLVKICEETHNLYTKAKDSLIETLGGPDNVSQELMSIRNNFIEQLKKGLDIETNEEQQEPENEPTVEIESNLVSSIGMSRRRIREKAEMLNNHYEETSLNELKSMSDDDEDDYDNYDDIDSRLADTTTNKKSGRKSSRPNAKAIRRISTKKPSKTK